MARHLKLYNQQFGDTAARIGLISQAQLNEARRHQKELQEKTKNDVSLGQVLLQLGHITEEQRAAIIAMLALSEDNQKSGESKALREKAKILFRELGLYNQRFGDLAMKLGFISEGQLKKSLEIQRKVQEKIKNDVPLSRVLEELKYLSEEQKAAILAVQGLTVETAPGSEKAKSGVEGFGPGAENGESDDEQILPGKQEPKEDEEQVKIHEYFLVDVSEDKLTARLMPNARDHEELVFEDVLKLIEAEGIKHGLVEKAVILSFFKDESEEPKTLTIAKGYPAGEGKDPEIVYHFETNPLTAGKLMEDGTIDWKDRGEIPQVDEGNLLVEIIPGINGTVGMDVFGNEIPALPIAKVSLKAGKGVKKSKDGNRFFAGAKGTPQLSRNDTLIVSPVLNIPGDIGVETGHVEFNGHIEVEGTVQSGYRVRGESFRAQSIDNAELHVSGDVVVTGGIFNSKINCEGNLNAVHVHNSDINSGGDLVVETEITESRIELYGICKVENGTIISSEIAAREGIIAKNVGTAVSKPSDLNVGVDHILRRKISGLKKLFSKTGRRKKDLTPQIETLKAQSDQINGELGEVAQKQDRYMVQLRQLKEKFKDHESIDEGLKAKYEKAIAELEAERSAIDTVVEELMKKDSEIETTIADLEEEATELAEDLTELEEKIEMLREKRETEKGKPVVKVSGDLFHGTKISGPKSKLTFKDDCAHVNIFETNKTKEGQSTRWHMKINPLR
ncbi:MAG: FapA family protein [Thermodesulfobacteriota bacterium]|nr:FapA family protein [Thermodesulfobacteriota bacterium]